MLRVDTGLRSVSARQGSRSSTEAREHADLGTAVHHRLSVRRAAETTR